MDITTLRAATPPALHSAEPGSAVTQASIGSGFSDSFTALQWCLEWHEEFHGHFPAVGERNNWIMNLAYFCNKHGVTLNDLETYCLQYVAPGLDEVRIGNTLRGIYRREADAHGSKAHKFHIHASYDKVSSSHEVSERAKALPPTFPEAIYEALPDYFGRCCAPFEAHEKAVMLLGLLGVLSGCFSGVGGVYNRKKYGLNLYVFIIAPAASGKGTLAWAQYLARPVHKRLVKESAQAHNEYETDLAAYKATTKTKGQPSSPLPPSPPPRRMLFLPGNVTAAALLGHMAENGGRGIIFETEADTLSGAMSSDFGNFGDMLRKAFHHEPVSALRKSERQHLDIERPALSIALTGTPGQVRRLMPTAEDGLVSRMLFYNFERSPEWQDVSPSTGPCLDAHFTPLADELTRMIDAVPVPDEEQPYPVIITLSANDWKRFNEAGAMGLADATQNAGEAGTSTAFRLGLIAWRIVGLLTIMRCFENGQVPLGRIEAHPTDVDTALSIMTTVREHALSVLDTMPSPSEARTSRHAMKAKQEARIKELHAQGQSLREIGKLTGLSKSTIERWLK